MRLIPKAKAVRIRIKSGGEEHSSLDSLKRNFNLSDVRVLLDGRLSRWLKQQGEHELASKIEGCDKQILADDDFLLCKLFFTREIDENNKLDIYSFADYCLDDALYRKTGINLFKKLIKQDRSIAKTIYKTSAVDFFTDVNWISIFSEYEDLGDPEILFFLGKLWYEGEGNNKDVYKGKRYIDKAVEEHLQVAVEYTQKMKYIEVNKERIKNWIENNWDNKYKRDYLEFDDSFNQKEENLMQFVRVSYELAYCVFHETYSNIAIIDSFTNRFVGINYIPEITLIKAILLKNILPDSYKKELYKINNRCKLAQIELSFAYHPFTNIVSTPQKIEYIVKHFLDD